VLTLTPDGEDIWGATDDCVLFHHAIGGDFVARPCGPGGNPSDWAILGGVMRRTSLSGGASNATVALDFGW